MDKPITLCGLEVTEAQYELAKQLAINDDFRGQYDIYTGWKLDVETWMGLHFYGIKDYLEAELTDWEGVVPAMDYPDFKNDAEIISYVLKTQALRQEERRAEASAQQA